MLNKLFLLFAYFTTYFHFSNQMPLQLIFTITDGDKEGKNQIHNIVDSQ